MNLLNNPIKLIVICGATATGKSSLALELAQRLNTVIISADSRQIYQGFDLGTAKPTREEQRLVKHYLIDICSPDDNFTLAQYQDAAQNLIKQCKNPLLVGGTGLYIKSITKGLKIPRVSPQNELRSQLASLGQKQIYNFLKQVDPISAQKIHPHDQVRTLRALEVFYTTGLPISTQQGENPPNYPMLHIGLDCNPDFLDHRIKHRTATMIEMGLVTEVESLINKYGFDLPLLNTLGYAEIKQYLTNHISLEEAKNLIFLHTRQFAKRQRTWFRAYREIQWFNVEDSNLLDRVWTTIENQVQKSTIIN